MKKPSPSHKLKPKKSVSKASPAGFQKNGKNARAVTTSVPHKNSSNPKILRLIEARNCLQREKQAHRKFILKTIADACTFGNELKEDEDAWQEFCTLDWGKLRGPKVDQRDQAIRFAMKFIFAKGKKGEKRASFYYNAVIGLVEAGLEGKALVKAIEKAGGLKKLQSQKSTNKPGAKAKTVFDDRAISDPVDEFSAGDRVDVSPFGTDEDEDEDEDTLRRFRERVDEEDDDDLVTAPKPGSNSVEMPFIVIFLKSPSHLISARLPARVVIKGHVTGLGKTSVLKVDRLDVKKPKI
ncbi:hypothetical protein FHT80_003929 [Rhizobium sp. BK226]|uniref:hypothetical protein n=1 Tax=Rhizobium sp. BK226 TaxID=2587075 RepID=UPI0016137A39|nr:hypothetical protein [Rhizobium sp. BK226]MBB4114578.1 hypothetical protein [Rhizobium sp. BK226]